MRLEPSRFILIVVLGLGCRTGRPLPDRDRSAVGIAGEESSEVQRLLEEGAASVVLADRSRALEALIHSSGEPAAGQWGPRGIWDPDPWIRLRSLRQIGARLPEEESRLLIRAVAVREESNSIARCVAVEFLGPEESAEWLPIIADDYRGLSTGSARIPCARVGLLLGDQRAIEALASGLVEDDLPADPEIIRGLSMVPAGLLHAELVQALSWAEEGYDLELARVAALRGVEEGWQRLEEALASEDELRGLESLELLAGLEHPRSTSMLRALRGGDTLAALGAEMILEGRSGRHGALREGARADERDIRVLAVQLSAEVLWEGAGGRLEREAESILTQALEDEAYAVRLAALHGLRRVATPSQLQLLGGMLETVDSSEQLEVALTIRYRMAAQSGTAESLPDRGPGEEP